jgi:hypothetical protein
VFSVVDIAEFLGSSVCWHLSVVGTAKPPASRHLRGDFDLDADANQLQ